MRRGTVPRVHWIGDVQGGKTDTMKSRITASTALISNVVDDDWCVLLKWSCVHSC